MEDFGEAQVILGELFLRAKLRRASARDMLTRVETTPTFGQMKFSFLPDLLDREGLVDRL